MRKLFLTLNLIFIVATFAFGQKVQYGLKAGFGFATQDIDNQDVSANSVTTYYINGYADLHLKSKFYLQAGIGVLGKGAKQYQNAQTNTITLTYLEVPATLLYKIDLPTLGKIYVGAGPYAAMGLSGNNQLENVNTTSGSSITFGNDGGYKKVDYGVNFATGLELNNHLTFNMRYSLGLNNIATDNDPVNTNTNSVKNQIFTIGLGFWL
ncbi:outer membrane protein with beta-barrel domain [Mucilaginibacter gracilis]|uniref:Outer membrane protein with beta-barrel domain n=1 Tax=Mucilaginibacter gracilis TaxID=423350 RepID=A0A495JA41_9SPHI|nr:porin family protein [Mucilaginibacter gracilis]RKR85232.1 outer membrane protein with beta-barrel domain [Mucilaginibacter gracilis]